MLQEFIDISHCDLSLSAIPVNQLKGVDPGLSQVTDLIIRPFGVDKPTDWTTYSTVEAIVDNTVTDNSAAKWLHGIGELPNPTESLRSMGKSGRAIWARTYTLSFNPSLLCGNTMDLLDELQTGWNRFSFWFRCWGGAAYGGSDGIIPALVNVRRPLGRGVDSFRSAEIRLTWTANGDPNYTHWSDFSPGVPAVSVPSSTPVNVIGDPDSDTVLGDDATNDVLGEG
jgi:hypothetical protein